MEQVQNLTVRNFLTGDCLYLSFDDVPDDATFIEYEVYRATGYASTYSLLAVTNVNSYYDSTAYESERRFWYYKVRAKYTGGFGTSSVATTWNANDFGLVKNILLENVRRKNFILTKESGHTAVVLVKKTRGVYCDCEGRRRVGAPARADCGICYAVGIVGGYELQYQFRVGRDATRFILQSGEHGLIANRNEEWWTLAVPRLRTGDLIVISNNDRFTVESVTPFASWRGNILWQRFSMQVIPSHDFRYNIPVYLASTPTI